VGRFLPKVSFPPFAFDGPRIKTIAFLISRMSRLLMPSIPSYYSFTFFLPCCKKNQKEQGARPRPLKGSTRAQHPFATWIPASDRWCTLGVPFPTVGGYSKEGKERCQAAIRQALYLPPAGVILVTCWKVRRDIRRRTSLLSWFRFPNRGLELCLIG
jgi:hypothetical protein